MTINWDEIAALTGISTVLMGGTGTVFAMYVSSVVSAKIDQKFREHTEGVLKPLLIELKAIRDEQTAVKTDLAVANERLRVHDRYLQCLNYRPTHAEGTGG